MEKNHKFCGISINYYCDLGTISRGLGWLQTFRSRFFLRNLVTQEPSDFIWK